MIESSKHFAKGETDNLTYTLNILISLIPLALITGPLVPELIVLFSGLIFIVISIKKKIVKLYFKNIYFYIFLLWCLFNIARSLYSVNPILSLESSLFYFRFIFITFSIIYLLSNYKNFINYFLLCLILCFIGLSIDGFIQFIFGKNILGYEYSYTRVSSFFNDEYILGSYLSRLYPLLFALVIVCFKRNFRAFIFLAFLYVTIDVLIFLSGERMAFFYLLLAGFIFLSCFRDYRKIRLYTLVASLFVIVLIVFNFESTKDRMIGQTLKDINLENSKNASGIEEDDLYVHPNKEVVSNSKINFFSAQHQAHYMTAYKMFKSNYLFGVGAKNFRYLCQKDEFVHYWKINNILVDGCSTHPHSIYLQLLAETGIVGFLPVLLIFSCLLYLIIKQFWLVNFTEKYYISDQTVSLIVCLLIFLWPFVPSGSFFNNWLSILSYLPSGFLLYYLFNDQIIKR